jgi:acyl-CoA synthetase (AMP-forming)/AMP-acid ligase II
VKVLVSGGSSLPLILEDFFEMIKTTVIVGYGMTETSPVITNRWVPPVGGMEGLLMQPCIKTGADAGWCLQACGNQPGRLCGSPC